MHILIVILFLFLSKLVFAGTMTATSGSMDYAMTRASVPDVLDGLVLHMPLRQQGISYVQDVSPYQVKGTITGALWAGIGNGLYFDGINDYVAIPYSAGTNIEGSKSVSLSVWVYPVMQDAGANKLVEKFRFVSGANRGGFYLHNSNAAPDFALANNSSAVIVTSPLAIGTATWTHICGVYNIDTGGSALLYINGVRVAAGTMSSGIGTHTVTNLSLSSPYASDNFNGYEDNVRIYNRALSDQEVYRSYTVTKH